MNNTVNVVWKAFPREKPKLLRLWGLCVYIKDGKPFEHKNLHILFFSFRACQEKNIALLYRNLIVYNVLVKNNFRVSTKSFYVPWICHSWSMLWSATSCNTLQSALLTVV